MQSITLISDNDTTLVECQEHILTSSLGISGAVYEPGKLLIHFDSTVEDDDTIYMGVRQRKEFGDKTNFNDEEEVFVSVSTHAFAASCVFWDEEFSFWSNEGCQVMF